MTQLSDLFSIKLFNEMLNTGMLRVQIHPEFPDLRIANYTEAAQFSRTWNEVTRACRGLIFNARSGEVLARPFQKIHNWDEAEAPRITWDAPLFSWSDKEDGSLGIMYRRPDGLYAIATRGSFASDQAVHATDVISDALPEQAIEMMDAGYTPLFEIVYPENRIVLDYGGRDELIPLGYIHIETGAYVPSYTNGIRTFDDIRQDLSRDNAEGWVVWLDPYKAVKIKQADYIELHRVVTGLNRKSIWRAMSEYRYPELLDAVPDELYDYVESVHDDLAEQFMVIEAKVEEYYYAAGADAGTQKQFALNVQEQVPRYLQGLVFSARSGKNLGAAIWKMIEPQGGER